MNEVCPQAGPQTQFLASSADIAIYGGAAGGGKTWALLMEPLRHVDNGQFGATIFRRNAVQITNQGGLWSEATKMYPQLGAESRQQPSLDWTFESGANIKFAHLEADKTVYNYQGSQIPLICYDELTHFSEYQFFYMLSRNRSMCGVRPYVRATTNPDADSWVANFIAWWINQDTGFAIPERSGVIRWFVRINDNTFWGDSAQELIDQFGKETTPKSVTFIASSIYDNKILMEADPGYIANLNALSTVERERLKNGNWKIRPAAGLYFQRSWVSVVDTLPADIVYFRKWDLAATEKTPTNDPDFTATVKMARDSAGNYYVCDAFQAHMSPFKVRNAVKNYAEQEGRKITIGLNQDPGQAGKEQAQSYVRSLAGYKTVIERETGDKVTRFEPFSAQCEAGNVYFLRGAWNNMLFEHLEAFPEAAHDDLADCCSGAFNGLHNMRKRMRISDKVLTGVHKLAEHSVYNGEGYNA